MKELVIASNNQGKIGEITSMIENIELLSLHDIGFSNEIPEPFHTFEENALTKASTVNQFCNKNVFADDSGICVNALNEEPGVDSAHYSGSRDDTRNLEKVLDKLQGNSDRSAYYKAVICLIWENKTYFFEGTCHGTITEKPIGTKGFGYDPIFMPEGHSQTFSELPLEIKNNISHRGKAIRKMVAFIKEQLENEILYRR